MHCSEPNRDALSAVELGSGSHLKNESVDWANDDRLTFHRNAPQPDDACLYGLVGEVARAGSDGTETNPYAIAVNFIAYLSCAVGRNPFLPVGNTWHHPRQYILHVGRSGRGRKGDAMSLVLRIDEFLRSLNNSFAPQIHRGGLSTREGLVALIHDGYKQGRQEVAPVADKRLWVIESEFANVLHQGRRHGNTLSTALRDCWDGISMTPATKSNRLYASNPHLCLSGAITPDELIALMKMRELTNGFANRFLMVWAERSQVVAFPKATPEATVAELARRVLNILEFTHADQHGSQNRLRLELTPQAQWRYNQLYRSELNEDTGHNVLGALLERRAPMLLRLAMLFALTDEQLRIDVHHIEASIAWIRHAVASARFIFTSAEEDAKMAAVLDMGNQILEFLKLRGDASRSDITVHCFKRHESKLRIDAAVDYLLKMTPAKIHVQIVQRPKTAPGTPTTIFRLA